MLTCAGNSLTSDRGRVAASESATKEDIIPERARMSSALAAVFTHAMPPRVVWERRCESRIPYGRPIAITPANEQGQFIAENSFSALGKNLSNHGIGFFTLEPVCARRVLTWLPAPGQKLVAFVTHLTWCRAAGLGWYENGGYFVRLWDSVELTDEQLRSALRRRLAGHCSASNFSTDSATSSQ